MVLWHIHVKGVPNCVDADVSHFHCVCCGVLLECRASNPGQVRTLLQIIYSQSCHVNAIAHTPLLHELFLHKGTPVKVNTIEHFEGKT